MADRLRILIVEDDEPTRERLVRGLSAHAGELEVSAAVSRWGMTQIRITGGRQNPQAATLRRYSWGGLVLKEAAEEATTELTTQGGIYTHQGRCHGLRSSFLNRASQVRVLPGAPDLPSAGEQLHRRAGGYGRSRESPRPSRCSVGSAYALPPRVASYCTGDQGDPD